MRITLSIALICLLAAPLSAQQTTPLGVPGVSTMFTRADTLRGSFTTPARAWWDVTYYDLNVAVQPADSSIRGHNHITYRVLSPHNELQVDLMMPLEIDSIVQDRSKLAFRREGNAFFVTTSTAQTAGALKTLTVYFHGKPIVAKRPPWDGGYIFVRDSLGNPWVATANQGVGASIWWPNKDTQADEPDSQRIAITVPKGMTNVSNGRLRKTTQNKNNTTTFEYFVKNPINNYNVAVNAGSYAHFSDVYQGENGRLNLDYYPIAYHLAAARKQFEEVKPMMQCFENWFGPYPWYEDGFKLIETPHLGMEHQSAVAYGNRYLMGYRGTDLSGTGVGLKFDFIIIHEAAHEWWGNNISTKDIADMWVHESFGNYAENLYIECRWGKQAGSDYVTGTRLGIQNDIPIVGTYGVNSEGSGDMYYKGGNMLHTIRHVIGDDDKWRSILRGLNKTFGKQTVLGKQIEEYISRESGIDLGKVFDQYLRNTQIPILEYKIIGDSLSYRWTSVIPGFDMPVRVMLDGKTLSLIKPTQRWQKARVTVAHPQEFRVDRNFYIGVMRDPPYREDELP